MLKSGWLKCSKSRDILQGRAMSRGGRNHFFLLLPVVISVFYVVIYICIVGVGFHYFT